MLAFLFAALACYSPERVRYHTAMCIQRFLVTALFLFLSGCNSVTVGGGVSGGSSSDVNVGVGVEIGL